eukprot:scaffold36233_cov58-Attheya_sp.AAC.1
MDDVREGFRNIYVGILANTQAHVISATLRHYIVHHGSRFRFSHKFVYIPVAQYEHYFRNTEIWTPIQIEQGGQFRLGSNIMNYVMGPQLLDDLYNLCFFVEYKDLKLTAILKDDGDFYPYPEEHPSKNTHCVIDRDDAQPLLPEIPFCLLPDLAKESTVEYTDDLTIKKAKHEEPSNLDIDMGLVDEAQDQDEEKQLFEKETGNPDSITLDTIRKYGKKECGYNHLTLPPCPLDSIIMGIEIDTHTGMQTPNHLPERERITFMKLIELSYKVDTSRRINPQQRAGAFEVATSNFVLIYHVDVANADDVMEDFWESANDKVITGETEQYADAI